MPSTRCTATSPPREEYYQSIIDWRTGKSLDQVIKAGWDVGVGWQDGRAFNGPCHIRMNVASPFSRVQEAFDRLDI